MYANQTRIAAPSMLRIWKMESRAEIIKMLRTPGFTLPSLLFPVLFYVFFGVVFSMNPASMPTYLLATYGTFGVIGPALFSFGVSIAVERGQGWFDVKEVSPMPASAYVLSRAAVALVFSLAVIVLLYAMGALFGGVELERSQWLLLTIVLLLGSLPFCAIGLTLGLYLKASSAPAVVNLIYLPMALLSGLWVPINFFPEAMQITANLLPAYHLSQLALHVVDMDIGGNVWMHIGVLLAWWGVFTALAFKAYQRKDKAR